MTTRRSESRGVGGARARLGGGGRAVVIAVAAFALALAPAAARAQLAPPPGYYDAATGLTGAALRAALHDIISGHTVIPYSSATSFDVHDAIDLLDEVPGDPASVQLLYSDATALKSSWPAYNREHVWPVSLGAEVGTIAHSDVHHIFACDADVNSLRSNRYFDECAVGCAVPLEAPACLYDFSSWEPPAGDKGDIARALFYVAVRYEGGIPGEPDLDLADFATATGCSCMAWLDTLLAWHQLDPVDARELQRNATISSSIQGNRNPFVDHPEYVAAIWGAPDAMPIAWINELHYDNGGADQDEGVEIAGPAGTALLGLSVVLYNGNGSVAYDLVHLSGVLPDQGGGFGTLWFDVAPLQNGAPDGVALVAPGDEILEFLSYEGTLTAVDGPAAGLTSLDMGVAESGGTPVGFSLQRVGSGAIAADFEWSGPAPHSRGAPNAGQDYSGSPGGGPSFVRGDCNADGAVDIGDPVAALDVLFTGAPPPPCLDACDANSDIAFDLGDAIFTLARLFSGGPPPAPPYPGCGTTSGGLGCDIDPACP